MKIRRSKISIVYSTYEDSFQALKKALSFFEPLTLGGKDKVVIKINMCSCRLPEAGAITHPKLLDSLLHYLRENFENLEIFVVESDATTVLADFFIKWLGYWPILEKWNAKWVNLCSQRVINKQIKGRHLKEVPVPEIFENSFFITVPKLKTNLLTKITCCLKNQFGCLPMVKKSVFHAYIDDVITDINIAIKSDLCLVDAIIAMGGAQGPGYGIPIPLKLIICSHDPVAVDALGARLLGFNPWFVGHIRKAHLSGIGNIKYEILGNGLSNPKVDMEVNKFEMLALKFASQLQMRYLLKARGAWRETK